MVTSTNPLQAFGAKHLYYLAPVKNIPSILKYGIMNKKAVQTLEIPYDDYSDQTVQMIRAGKSLHEYVPLFLNTRNAMTFRYQKENRDFAILRLNSDLVTHYDCLVSDRIPACSDAEILVNRDIVEPEWIECIILDRTARKINGVSIKQLRDSGYNYYF